MAEIFGADVSILTARTPIYVTSLPAASALVGYYTDPLLAKDDYRGMARYIAAVAQPEVPQLA